MIPKPQLPGRVSFSGPETAAWFSREVAESLAGVLAKNMISDPANPMLGFIFASIDGRPWSDTMWTRDTGVFLRELVHWGYLDTACLIAVRLIDLVQRSPQGYRTFPTFFRPNQPASGSELDGTSAILIAFSLLWNRLDRTHPCARFIADFFTTLDSPVEYILHQLETYPLVPGSGEFGGGCGIEGEFYNVVQNNLVALALAAAQQIYHAIGFRAHALRCDQAIQHIQSGLNNTLRGPDGGWIWAVDTHTLKPDPLVLNDIFNQGFGGLNGMLSMPADVYGLDTQIDPSAPPDPGIITFERLFAEPRRRELFERYGVWTQFDRLYDGYLSGPSYGHGYATQTMLLLDRMRMAAKAVDFLARITLRPFPGNHLDRESAYFFYERFYLPELLEAWKDPADRRKGDAPDWIANAFDGQSFDQGCGALNLVNVAEPLKIARLIIGVDNPNPQELKLIPRIPPGWDGFSVSDWPIMTPAGLARLNFDACCPPDGGRFVAVIHTSMLMDALDLRIGPFPSDASSVDLRINESSTSAATFRSGDSAWAWVHLNRQQDYSVEAVIKKDL
jgi:hypothetical protein